MTFHCNYLFSIICIIKIFFPSLSVIAISHHNMFIFLYSESQFLSSHNREKFKQNYKVVTVNYAPKIKLIYCKENTKDSSLDVNMNVLKS